MISTYLHTLNDSFRLWFENQFLSEGSGFRNVSGQLYKTDDLAYKNSGVYSNPYGQWVYDSSIGGANIPSGVFVDGRFIPRGTSGLVLDFERGRAIFATNNIRGTVTASYASKDFSVYSTTLPDNLLIFADKLQFRPKFNVPITGIPAGRQVAPLVYLKRDVTYNEPWALGGQDLTTTNYRAIAMSDSDYNLDALGSIMADANKKNFMLLNTQPLNRHGDLTTGYYNYINDYTTNYNNTTLVHIADTDFYRFDANSEVAVGVDFRLGFIEFTLEIPRYPRQS